MTLAGVEDVLGIINRVYLRGVEDRLLQKPYEELEDLGFWDDDDEDNPFWRGKPRALEPNQELGEVPKPPLTREIESLATPEGALRPASINVARQAQQTQDLDDFKPGRWMATYDNGRIPVEALDSIGQGHFLRPDAAAAWKAMRRAARRDGVKLTVTDSYRDFETQEACVAAKGLYSKGGLCAAPGTSEHGWGLAVDAGEGEQRTWLANNAGRFGFTTIPREPWHWEYGGGYKAPVNAFRQRPRAKRSRPRPRNPVAATVGVVEGVHVAPEFSSLTVLPGAVLSALTEPDPPRTRRGAAPSTGSVPSFVPKRERDLFMKAARSTGLPVRLLAFVARKESSFRANKTTISSAGAIGRMQLMPGTAEGLGVNPYNLAENIMGGARYLALMLKNFNGNIRKALAAYNAGPGGWQRGLGYADEILAELRG